MTRTVNKRIQIINFEFFARAMRSKSHGMGATNGTTFFLYSFHTRTKIFKMSEIDVSSSTSPMDDGEELEEEMEIDDENDDDDDEPTRIITTHLDDGDDDEPPNPEELEAWKQIHQHLKKAILIAQEAVRAKKMQRRYWMEEICANLTEEGKLISTSVWQRPKGKRKSVTKKVKKETKESKVKNKGTKKRKEAIDDGSSTKKRPTIKRVIVGVTAMSSDPIVKSTSATIITGLLPYRSQSGPVSIQLKKAPSIATLTINSVYPLSISGHVFLKYKMAPDTMPVS